MTFLFLFNTAHAAQDVDSLISSIGDKIINPLILLMMSVALAFFVWGVIEFMANSNNEEKRSIGKQHMIWGIIGLFIMVAVGGIIEVISNFVNSMK